jgi:hypothetical protein
LTGAEQQFDLFAAFGLNHIPAAEDIPFRPCHRQRALFPIALVNAAKPFLVEADAPVVFAQNGLKPSVGPSNETDVVRSGIEILSGYDNVRRFRPLVAVEPAKRAPSLCISTGYPSA